MKLVSLGAPTVKQMNEYEYSNAVGGFEFLNETPSTKNKRGSSYRPRGYEEVDQFKLQWPLEHINIFVHRSVHRRVKTMQDYILNCSIQK